jgi:hypothetical protein
VPDPRVNAWKARWFGKPAFAVRVDSATEYIYDLDVKID